MSDIVFIGVIIWVALLVVHLARLGTYYIEFTGSEYLVRRRAFLGFDTLHKSFSSEADARAQIVALKANPPRRIKS